MNKTNISLLIPSPDEYNVAAMPNKEEVEEIIKIQGELRSLLGETIWLTSPNTLHCTLMEIICNVDYLDKTREEHFLNWYNNYNEITRETIAKSQPFSLTFNELCVSESAIILKASNPEPFNSIRQALLGSIKLPTQTKLPPSITHCTIARYNQEVNLDKLRVKTADLKPDIRLFIKEFDLMKDLGPDFHPTKLETYNLSK